MSLRPISHDTRERQRRASDPQASAWVSAHAGSGKTHVLSQRVVRLLLSGVAPSRILCLTYTKAAAANMSARISSILAQWSLLGDAELTEAIVGVGASAPGAKDLQFARRLFARTVETPGGLKIQTIHAFCERVLHLFPFEANVSANFRVLDDVERTELLERARHETLGAAVRHGGAFHSALQLVARQTSVRGFDELIQELLHHRDILRELTDFDAYSERLRRSLGLSRADSLAEVEDEILNGGIPPSEWPAIAAVMRQGGINDRQTAETLENIRSLPPSSAAVENYLLIFLKTDGGVRGAGKSKLISKDAQKHDSGLLSRLEAERDRVAMLAEKRKAILALERSLALAKIGDAIVGVYSRLKENRGLFDFDDLIERTRALLRRTSVSWVLYKLDQQIDHILLDEAQDTSAEQWEILDSLAEEFCAGAGARTVGRTFFAVGDEKQSIFSFQGAAPDKFGDMRRSFETKFVHAGRSFERIELTRSFRSVPDILHAVDTIFAPDSNRRGLFSDPKEPPMRHEAHKVAVPGLVEIWAPIGPQEREPRKDWRLPLDYADSTTPSVRLAQKIASKIGRLIDPASGESVEDKGAQRGVTPGDIMILVRKRDAFFDAMIAALKSANIAVAGADRLVLIEHIAVTDLIAFGRSALLREDDLTLATVLKSPLFGLDDNDLMIIAPERSGSLFEALSRSDNSTHVGCARKLEEWSQHARELTPFDFYSRVLGAGRGRERLVARLGFEANDAIDEFLQLALAFEREQAPSLVNFLASVASLDISIKRDMEAAAGAVRVMTVHAAKGLEAKIVFLPDSCGAPSARHDPKLFALGPEGEHTLAWSLKKESDPAAIHNAREVHREAAQDEYRRLLYVALTRAEERLYVGGFHGERGPASGCWHQMIVEALASCCEDLPDPLEEGSRILRYGSSTPSAPVADVVKTEVSMDIPEFVFLPAPEERAPSPPLRPSNALASADSHIVSDEVALLSRKDNERLLVGRLTHTLLQYLPAIVAEQRAEAARRFLDVRGAALSHEQRAQLARAAIDVIEDPRLTPLFGPSSLAEVDIVARLWTAKGEASLSGRIDRLAEAGDEILVGDFKTGAPRSEPDEIHLRQLALYRAAVAQLYPGKRIRCYLIWTANASAVEATETALENALAAILKAA
jgi:ATP-dependent helicase/nuclease subunit A